MASAVICDTFKHPLSSQEKVASAGIQLFLRLYGKHLQLNGFCLHHCSFKGLIRTFFLHKSLDRKHVSLIINYMLKLKCLLCYDARENLYSNNFLLSKLTISDKLRSITLNLKMPISISGYLSYF